MPMLLRDYETKIGAKEVKLRPQYQRIGQKIAFCAKPKVWIILWSLVDNSLRMGG